MVMMLILILLPVTFLLRTGAGAGEIIGGHEAVLHSRLYMAQMKTMMAGNREGVCRGFLIREDIVVTAAHCNCILCNTIVMLGAHNVDTEECGRQEIRVHHRIPHPEYNDKTKENDIMLLQGDSGGPLVCGGIAKAFGSVNGNPPAVYTRVSTFVSWIQETMRKLQP